ncbi:MAG: sigma-70 family RNA polymerase sigma factor [Cyanobacteria bacterium P01_H01_bin.21]
MEALNQTLKQLVREALSFPVKSPPRQQRLHRLYLLVTKSGKLWREPQNPYYGDALNDMWYECFTHLEDYNPDLQQVTTWLNDSLKRALRRYRYRAQQDCKRHITHWIDENGQTTPVVEHLPGRLDAKEALESVLNPVLCWIQADPDEKLKTRVFRKRSDINAQSLLLRRLPPQSQDWPTIALDFGLSSEDAHQLSQWYSRYCKPLLKDFGGTSGILQIKV